VPLRSCLLGRAYRLLQALALLLLQRLVPSKEYFVPGVF
jgi:hypothetical protein